MWTLMLLANSQKVSSSVGLPGSRSFGQKVSSSVRQIRRAEGWSVMSSVSPSCVPSASYIWSEVIPLVTRFVRSEGLVFLRQLVFQSGSVDQIVNPSFRLPVRFCPSVSLAACQFDLILCTSIISSKVPGWNGARSQAGMECSVAETDRGTLPWWNVCFVLLSFYWLFQHLSHYKIMILSSIGRHYSRARCNEM